MSRIVLLIDHVENRRLLAEWLSQLYEVVAPAPGTAPGGFDLAIVDGPSLDRYARWIDAVKRAAQPVFLPFVLITSRRGVGMATGPAWQRIDELIISPVEKVELLARVDTLLHARALSVANTSLARRLEQELARAREVQVGLLPVGAPRLHGFELAARCIPANEVGGDFFDWQITEDAAVISVGDVMGKGIPAALLAATVRAVLRALARQNAPGAALDLLRETLSDDLERTSSFVTLFHARLDPCGRRVRYVDAGHGHAFVRRARGVVERLERGGRPVGFPAAERYHESTLALEPGDVLFVYSDGLIEGVERGTEELIEGVDPGAEASAIVEQIIERAPRAPDSVDDVTLLALKCAPEEAAP